MIYIFVDAGNYVIHHKDKTMFIDFDGLICFDLETTSSHKTLDEMGEQNPRMIDLWLRLCEKRQKAGDERFNESMTPEEKYYENAGLYPEFGRIVNASFGMFKQNDDTGESVIQVVSIGGGDEAAIPSLESPHGSLVTT